MLAIFAAAGGCMCCFSTIPYLVQRTAGRQAAYGRPEAGAVRKDGQILLRSAPAPLNLRASGAVSVDGRLGALFGFMDRAAFESELKKRCPSVADAAMAALEPWVALEVASTGEDVPVGASKLGGVPDLPADLEWPAWGGRPLDFLAQIDLAELEIETGLPKQGLLLFFADTLNCAGLSPSDREGFRVLWTEDDVEPRALPGGQRALRVRAARAERRDQHRTHRRPAAARA